MKESGFSLVEVLLCFSLITFLIMGTAQLIIHSFLVQKTAETNFKLAELGSSMLEWLKSFPYESEELKEGYRTESLKQEGTKESFRREWRIEDISSNMKRIEVEVFSRNTPKKKIELVLFLSRELGF